ncbi:MAG TPA: DegQ family serine endoprotease [Burkholderiaceae bacterium]|nr:DegQ family serine endoprotease [Burkholderiaceae bacterium]
MHSKQLVKPTLIAAAVAAAFVIGQRSHGLSEATAAAPVAAPITQAATPRSALPDFSALVDANGAAVVNIAVTKRATMAPTQFDEDGPMGDMLRRFGVPTPEGRSQGREGHGVGSGFIVASEGTILTNAHVVDGASELIVRLADQREFKGKVLGADKLTDVAVVKIDAKDLPTVKTGDPAKLKVGEWVAAIGSPFGLENSVTAGIVSAKSRALPQETLVPFIQTDVAVNPGNSGGPLFNMAGEVVGINSQIFSTSGGYMGLSFAIPIDLALKVKDDLVAHGKVTRGRIGVGIQPMDAALAESFGLDRARGALVSRVEPNSPAAKAGLKEGDVIVEFNGKPIGKSNDLPAAVAQVSPGTKAPLKVWRNKSETTLDVTVGELPNERVAQAPADAAKPRGKLGVAVRPLTPEEARELQSEGGLVVRESSGPAARAGLRAGDVIVAVNGQPTRSVDELRKLVGEAKGKLAVLVERQGQRVFVPVDIG